MSRIYYKKSEDIFRVLNSFFCAKNVDDAEKRRVWQVLSALRGPDIENSYGAKIATTGLIRGKLFGNSEFLGRHVDIFTSDRDEFVDIRRSIDKNMHLFGTIHFVHHVLLAFEALNLGWSKLNED